MTYAEEQNYELCVKIIEKANECKELMKRDVRFVPIHEEHAPKKAKTWRKGVKI